MLLFALCVPIYKLGEAPESEVDADRDESESTLSPSMYSSILEVVVFTASKWCQVPSAKFVEQASSLAAKVASSSIPKQT